MLEEDDDEKVLNPKEELPAQYKAMEVILIILVIATFVSFFSMIVIF